MSAAVMASGSERSYLPAAGHDLFLPLYDLVTKLIGGDQARRELLNQAKLRPNDRVLEIGWGTGTLAISLKQTHPAVQVVGLDPDPKALNRARHKARRAGVEVQFDQGFADTPAYPSHSFDAVFSSFMFHHLEADVKQKTLSEVRRVLKPSGHLHLLDFEVQESGSGHTHWQLFHSHKRLKDNSENRMLALLSEAGFADANKAATRSAIFGLARMGYYEAVAPSV
jgi:ubiquinone/menaquinone biosynthesis C-methylase UbiE